MRGIFSSKSMRGHSAFVLSALLWAGLATAPPAAAARLHEVSYTGCGGVEAPAVDETFELRVVELVNQERANHGNLPPLKRVTSLTGAARYHATDLGVDNYFEHDSYDRNGGTLNYMCDTFERMSLWYQNWRTAAENIAAGQQTPTDVVADWMASSGHRSNILNQEFTEIGVGFYTGTGDYGTYWVQNFGARREVYPLIINRDSPTTDDRAVDVYIYGAWSEMRLRNNRGAWSDWRPFASSFTWTLGEGSGAHTITAELRAGSKRHTTCDEIRLEDTVAAPPLLDATQRLYLPSVVNDLVADSPLACE